VSSHAGEVNVRVTWRTRAPWCVHTEDAWLCVYETHTHQHEKQCHIREGQEPGLDLSSGLALCECVILGK
jgi:hypothetical protein